jgi:hypothetical protein
VQVVGILYVPTDEVRNLGKIRIGRVILGGCVLRIETESASRIQVCQQRIQGAERNGCPRVAK